MKKRQIARNSYWLVAAGDIACFAVFVLFGLRSHAEALTPDNMLRAGGPFLACWLVSASAFRLFSEPTPLSTKRIAERVLLAWLPAWALGLFARSFLFGRPLVPAFAIVALLFNAALLMLWRASWSDLARRKLIAS